MNMMKFSKMRAKIGMCSSRAQKACDTRYHSLMQPTYSSLPRCATAQRDNDPAMSASVLRLQPHMPSQRNSQR